METRVKECKATRIAASTFLNWSMESNYEFNPLGRIWVVWSSSVELQVVFKSAQMISCLIKVIGKTDPFLCSFVYASNLVAERKEL